MSIRRLLLFTLCAALPACDLLEPLPDEPPPDGATHPYGEGNGKVVFLSDLADAVWIDVTLGGESIGAVTRFTGCPGRVTTDDSLAVAIRPAGTYQYAAQSTTGFSWGSTIRIDEDEVTRQVLIGRPSRYAVHLPAEIEGFPVAQASQDYFHYTAGRASQRLAVSRPPVVQGDRIDIVHNGSFVARGVALAASEFSFDITLTPGPNYVAARLSQDADGDGARVSVQLDDADGYVGHVHRGAGGADSPLRATRWSGINLRYQC